MDQDEKLVPIRFVENSTPHFAGEVAGFSTDKAKAFVEAGVAEFYDPEATAEKSLKKPTVDKMEKGAGTVSK